MTRDRMMLSDMTAERAADMVAHIAHERQRWGKHYLADEIVREDLLDAIIFLASHESQEVLDLRETVKALKGQLNASKAREAKLNKLNAKLRGEEDE